MKKINKMQICAIGLCIFLVTAVFSTAANSQNKPPIASDDEATMKDNEISVTIPILDNDEDPDGFLDPGSVKIVQDPSQGKVQVDKITGVATYTRINDFIGQDKFDYTVNDNKGAESNVATVIITVIAGQINTPPVANDDEAIMECNAKSVQIEVLNNDFDKEDGIPTLDKIIIHPEHGEAPINGDKIQYIPIDNFSGIDKFVYQVMDSGKLTDNATVSVTVDSCQTNNPPVAENDDATMVYNQESVNIDILANDKDSDGKIDSTTVTIVKDPSQGKVQVDKITGVVTYTLINDFIGQDKFNYTVNDNEGAKSNIATVTITIIPGQTNNPPVAEDDEEETEENESKIIDVLKNDYDVDGDPLEITDVSKANHGITEIIIGPTEIPNEPYQKILYTPDPGYKGEDTFEYTITDGNEGEDTATVSVIVGSCQSNNPPVAEDDEEETEEDEPKMIYVLANDYDVDGDPLEITDVSNANHGTTEIITEPMTSGTQSRILYTPNQDYNGEDEFTYVISDGRGGKDIAIVHITISSVNDNPIAKNDDAKTEENKPKTIDVLKNDYDVDGDDLKIISVSEVNHGKAEIITEIANEPYQKILYTPDKDFKGEDTFEYTIQDGHGGEDTAIVHLEIEPDAPSGGGDTGGRGSSAGDVSNSPPVADASAGEPYQGFVDEELTFDGSLSFDSDGSIVSWSWNFGDGNIANGEITTHAYSSIRTYLVTLIVSDNQGATDKYITTATIIQPNRPPSSPDIYGPEISIMGTKYSYAALSKDLDGDNIKYVFDWGDGNTDESEFLSLQQSYAVSFIHSWSSAGNYTIIVTVSDNQTTSSSQISIVVIEPAYDYTAVIILGSIMAFFVILSLILVKTGAISKFGKK